MADTETKLTQADIDRAVADAIARTEEGLKAKNGELMDEVKKLKADLRKTQEIKPEDLAALESENEKLRADNAKLASDLKTAQATAEKATKALETEQGAARSYALDAEINAAIAAGNIVPALVPAFTAMVKQQAKADLADGKYAVTIGDKAAREYISEFLGTEEGKAFQAAPVNGGGGAPGGKQGDQAGKTMTRAQWDQTSPADRMAFSKAGGQVVEPTA